MLQIWVFWLCFLFFVNVQNFILHRIWGLWWIVWFWFSYVYLIACYQLQKMHCFFISHVNNPSAMMGSRRRSGCQLSHRVQKPAWKGKPDKHLPSNPCCNVSLQKQLQHPKTFVQFAETLSNGLGAEAATATIDIVWIFEEILILMQKQIWMQNPLLHESLLWECREEFL